MKPYYKHGNAALYCGDLVDVLAKVDVAPDLILTSPPYDNLRDYGGHGFNFDRVADALVKVMSPGSILVWVVADATVDGSETGTSFRQALGFMDRGLNLHDTMIYEKAFITNPRPEYYYQGFEFMFVFSKSEIATFNPIIDRPNIYQGEKSYGTSFGRDPSGKAHPVKNPPVTVTPQKGKRQNIWRYSNNGYPKHPAVFPLLLARDHIRTWTNPGGLVLDPMAGSGTTLRAAKDLGRSSIGIEVHQPYVDLIRRRMAQEVLALW